MSTVSSNTEAPSLQAAGKDRVRGSGGQGDGRMWAFSHLRWRSKKGCVGMCREHVETEEGAHREQARLDEGRSG